MSIAEKLQTISDNVQLVYDAGYAKGFVEGGNGSGGGNFEPDMSFYDIFWDTFQMAQPDENGEMKTTKTSYYYAFANNHWNDEIYNPKYDIYCTAGTTYDGANVFYDARNITDTKVNIYCENTTINNMFTKCSRLETIRLLSLTNVSSHTSTFNGCTALKNITIAGTIIANFNIANSTLLSKDSITSIINALSTTADGLTVTLSSTAVKKAFETSENAKDGDTSAEWAALIAPYTNWTIKLS